MTTTTSDLSPPAGAEAGAIPADTLGARLMLARAHAGYLTVKEAADRCQLNYGSWSNWERGKRPRDLLEVVERISKGLGIDRDWLLFGGPLARAAENRQRWSRPAGSATSTATLTYPYPPSVISLRPVADWRRPGRGLRSVGGRGCKPLASAA